MHVNWGNCLLSACMLIKVKRQGCPTILTHKKNVFYTSEHLLHVLTYNLFHILTEVLNWLKDLLDINKLTSS